MKIIKHNLGKPYLAFLEKELSSAVDMAERRLVSVPRLDISLEICEPPTSIVSDYHEYTDQQRKLQSFSIRRNGFRIFISGGGYPGILNGLYTLLKNELGIRWYGLTDEDICFIDEPVIMPENGEPDVPLRGIESCLSRWTEKFIKQFMLWMARNGWNQLLVNAVEWQKLTARKRLLRYAELCAVNIVIGGHSFELFLPDDVFKYRPEFFGMRDGARCVKSEIKILEQENKTFLNRIQPCLSNPECMAFIARNIVDYIDKFEEINVFSLWPHDGVNNWCQCEKCKKLAPYELMHQLARHVLKGAKRKIFIELLAYSNLLKPPSNLPYEPSIYTLFCPYLRNYRKRIFASGFPRENVKLGSLYPDVEPVNPADDREYGHLLNAWLPEIRKSGGTFGIFAYYQLVFHDMTEKSDRSRYLRYPSPELIKDELQYFVENGLQVYYDCSWPYPGFWPDARLYSFYSYLLWDHKIDIVPLIKEYSQTLGGVAQSLDRICNELDAGRRDSSDLRQELLKLKNAKEKRIRIWAEYVFWALKSYDYRKQNEASKVIAVENRIIELFKKHRHTLKSHILVDWMISHSKSIINNEQKSEKIL
jgi:hypothetical protein